MREPDSQDEKIFSHDQLVHEFQSSCAPRQRALLSVLAVCDKYNLDSLKPKLVASLAHDLPRTPLESRRKTRKFYWAKLEDFSTSLETSENVQESLSKFPGLLPETVELGLNLEDENGSLCGLSDAWLRRGLDETIDRQHNHVFIARMFPLFLKGLVFFFVIGRVVSRLIPEFVKMREEYGVEQLSVLTLAVEITDFIARFWFIPFLIGMLLIPFLIPAILRYLKRWNPFVWKQRHQPSSALARQALALLTLHKRTSNSIVLNGFKRLKRALKTGNRGDLAEEQIEDSENTQSDPIDWKQLAIQGVISPQEAQALQTAQSPDVKAWLLRKRAGKLVSRFESQGRTLSRTIEMTANVVFAIAVLLMAVTVFSTLIAIMARL